MNEPNDGLRVTNRDLWIELRDFRTVFQGFVNETAPRMAVVELKVEQATERLDEVDQRLREAYRAKEELAQSERGRKATQRWMVLAAVAGSSTVATALQWVFLHK